MKLFISYHSADEALASSLQDQIQRAAPHITAFFAPYNLKLGAFWIPALSQAINDADAFLLILGRRLGEWQKLEYYEAIDKKTREEALQRTFPLITVRLQENTPTLPFMNQIHWVQGQEPISPPVVTRILDALGGKHPPSLFEPWQMFNPYRGLESLREEDADLFFGRDAEIEQILDTIISRPNCLIALIGSSGVGKTSLVQAGVVAALKRQTKPLGSVWPFRLKETRAWAYLSMKPGDYPIRALASAFARLWFEDPTDAMRAERAQQWEVLLQKTGRLSDLLDATEGRFAQLGIVPPRRTLLYIDQGEELYSRNPAATIGRFSEIIAKGLSDERFIALTSQRADFYGSLQANSTLFELTERIDVRPIGQAGLKSVIIMPAQRLGVKFESEQFIEDLLRGAQDQPGALPLLADLMSDLWGSMQSSGRPELRPRSVDDIRLGRNLSARATRFITEFPQKQETLKRLFSARLCIVQEYGEAVRRRLLRSECSDEEWALVQELARPDWRLLVTAEEEGEPTAEIAHEVLIREWPVLKGWLDEERVFHVWQTRMRHLARSWSEAALEYKRRKLLDEHQLTEALEWLKKRGEIMLPEIKDYMLASVQPFAPRYYARRMGVPSGFGEILVPAGLAPANIILSLSFILGLGLLVYYRSNIISVQEFIQRTYVTRSLMRESGLLVFLGVSVFIPLMAIVGGGLIRVWDHRRRQVRLAKEVMAALVRLRQNAVECA